MSSAKGISILLSPLQNSKYRCGYNPSSGLADPHDNLDSDTLGARRFESYLSNLKDRHVTYNTTL